MDLSRKVVPLPRPAIVLTLLVLVPAWGSAMPAEPAVAPVVVATFDTGTNPWHPCWKRAQEHPADVIPTYPSTSVPIRLTFGSTYGSSAAASQAALATIQPRTLHHVPNTSLSFYGANAARTAFVDDYPHGAQASSQIGCAEYGLAPNAQVLILNWYDEYGQRLQLYDWVAMQRWIDIVHLNIQDTPNPLSWTDTLGIAGMIDMGKLVVIAAGNGVQGGGASYPMELSRFNGAPGSLIAGANDNGGYTSFSNLDPHVVMDGLGTVAAAPTSFGSTTFGGTSSASPRITGYAARILGELRAEFGHTGVGLLTIPAGAPRPAQGPLADGVLVAAELHEVIRKTADPNPHESQWDGTGHAGPLWRQPADYPVAFYPKMGFGEVSEHTLPHAVDVLAGRAPMPIRVEEAPYLASEAVRIAYWGTVS